MSAWAHVPRRNYEQWATEQATIQVPTALSGTWMQFSDDEFVLNIDLLIFFIVFYKTLRFFLNFEFRPAEICRHPLEVLFIIIACL